MLAQAAWNRRSVHSREPNGAEKSNPVIKPGVKRGTLLKVPAWRRRSSQLTPSLLTLPSQGTACAVAATASAGTAGRATPARSGWEKSTEGGGRGPEQPDAAALIVTTRLVKKHRRKEKTKLNLDFIQHITNSIHYFIVLVTSDPYCRCGRNILPCKHRFLKQLYVYFIVLFIM